jgi:hypothetical protein
VQGERVNTAKLTTNQVLAMRQMFANGLGGHKDLGLVFGVSKSSAGAIIRRQTWKHI